MRGDRELQVEPPHGRQAVGFLVVLLAGAVLLGWVPFGQATFGVALLLVGAGLLV